MVCCWIGESVLFSWIRRSGASPSIKDAPLDMRMSKTGRSAADVVNTYDEAALADILYRYGEDKFSCRIAARL